MMKWSVESGEKCALDDECKSGICRNNTCTWTSSNPTGTACGSNSECASGTCGYGIDNKKECCSRYEPMVLYITPICPRENGAKCAQDAHCMSGLCFDDKCSNFKEVGEHCRKDDHCKNKRCGRMGKDERLECCAGDMRTHWAGGLAFKDWCIEGPGSDCNDDMQCTSDRCVAHKCT